jgi:hypothetical protein
LELVPQAAVAHWRQDFAEGIAYQGSTTTQRGGGVFRCDGQHVGVGGSLVAYEEVFDIVHGDR